MPSAKIQLAQRSKALTHPLRVRIIAGALEPGRVASPSELAEELGEPLEQVAYHVSRLAEWGCLEFVEDRETPRGAIEHFYRLAERPYYDPETWEALAPSERSVVARGILTAILDDIAGADAAGVLESRGETHVTRTPLELDDEGWAELDALLVTLLDGAHGIAAEATARVAAGRGAFDERSSARLLLIAMPAPRQTAPAARVAPTGQDASSRPVADLGRRYKALSHPLRAKLVSALVGRVASPSELAEEMDEPLSSVSYHVRRLVALGCLELVDKRKRRGAIERFYRVIEHPHYDSVTWHGFSREQRVSIMRETLTAALADIVAADAGGILVDPRLEMHFSRSPLRLDDQGWSALDALLLDTLDGAREVAQRSASRAAAGETADDELTPARLMMLLIPAPPRPE